MLRSGNLCGESIRYQDSEVVVTIWRDLEGDEGICFDFNMEEIDDILSLLQQLKEAEPEDYKAGRPVEGP